MEHPTCPNQMCRQFWYSKDCKFGDTCRFDHVFYQDRPGKDTKKPKSGEAEPRTDRGDKRSKKTKPEEVGPALEQANRAKKKTTPGKATPEREQIDKTNKKAESEEAQLPENFKDLVRGIVLEEVQQTAAAVKEQMEKDLQDLEKDMLKTLESNEKRALDAVESLKSKGKQTVSDFEKALAKARTEHENQLDTVWKQHKNEFSFWAKTKLATLKQEIAQYIQGTEKDSSEARRSVSKEGGITVAEALEKVGIHEKHNDILLLVKPCAEGQVNFVKGAVDLDAQRVEGLDFEPFKPASALSEFEFEVLVFNNVATEEEVALKEPHKLVRFKFFRDWSTSLKEVCDGLIDQLYKCEECTNQNCTYMIHPGEGE